MIQLSKIWTLTIFNQVHYLIFKLTITLRKLGKFKIHFILEIMTKNLSKETGQVIRIVCYHTENFQVHHLIFNFFSIMNLKYYYEEKKFLR